MTKALFVSNQNYLAPTGGGVQWCTRDYLDTIAAAGLQTEVFAYANDQSFSAKIRRNIHPRPFADLISPHVVGEIVATQKATGASWIFLNNSEPLVLAADLKKQISDSIRIIYLSHGVESTDQINELRLAWDSVASHRRQPAWIGRLFLAELAQRRHLDGVVCISQEDVLFEQWLGSQKTLYLPRSIPPSPLSWRPLQGRVGTVATLSHIPNMAGICDLADELEQYSSVHLRVVGGPRSDGERLAKKYRSIEYVGSLAEDALNSEAATWGAFVNPIFCQARGASTKVATALGWGLPVLTSQQGARGYRWDDAILSRMQTAKELAQMASQVAMSADQKSWRTKALHIAKLAPSITESGTIFKDFLYKINPAHLPQP